MSKKKILIAAAALVVGVAAVPVVHAAGKHDDHHHHAASDGPAVKNLKLNDGKKWEIDAPLRKSMEAIRADLAKAWDPIHDDSYTPAQYKALAGRIEAQVAEIVANCRLPPDADAQLHYVIADIVGGATTMKGDKNQLNGVIQVVGALGAYPKYFDHAGWKPLAH